jgi:hypothetical protein
MKTTIRIDEIDYVVDQAKVPPYVLTIDGEPLTLLSDATTMERYALETKILALDTQMRARAQADFNRMLREQTDKHGMRIGQISMTAEGIEPAECPLAAGGLATQEEIRGKKLHRFLPHVYGAVVLEPPRDGECSWICACGATYARYDRSRKTRHG